MKNLIFFSVSVFALSIFLVVGCKKDLDFDSKVHHSANSGATVNERNTGGPTVLGEKRSIPYKVDVMKQAYNNLHEPDINSLSPNYRYVRFLPHSPQDVKKLLESGFEFWDYPLDYDIVSHGEKYHDPSVPESDLTWQYTVLKADAIIPAVQYEVLEELALVPEDCALAQEAFRLTGNAYQAPEKFDPDPPIVVGRFGEIEPNDDPGGTTGGGGTPPPSGNECGCPTPSDVRIPSGCVQVYDNMLHGWEGVKHVEVHTSKTHIFGEIFHREDETNGSGCWQINHEYHGSIHVWVRWESSTCNVKTMDGNLDLLGYSFPRRNYIGEFWGPYFNNLPIKFDHTSAINSSQFRDWVASTANNAVHEFGGYVSSNGIIGSLPDNLILLVTPWGSGGNVGAAPMLDKLGTIQTFIINAASFVFLTGVPSILNPVLSPLLPPLGLWLEVTAPDISLNLNNSGDVNSDDIRDVMYHELSHALHFNKVGSNYWLENIAYIIFHNGYGDGTGQGAGRCSVIESWGFCFGTYLTHLRYGVNNSNGSLPNTNTFRALLESSYAWPTDNEIVHIPFGWEWDLQDNNATNPSNEDENPAVTDAVSGFTNAQIFSKMNSNMQSMPQLKTSLVPFLPSTVSMAQYNSLSGSYGF